MKKQNKNKKDDNLIFYVPYKNPNFKSKENDEGKITLIIEQKGIVNKIAQKLFFSPEKCYLHLDNLGSFVWKQIDGKKNIHQIADRIKKEHEGSSELLYERLVMYLKRLQKQGYILIRRPEEANKLYFQHINTDQE